MKDNTMTTIDPSELDTVTGGGLLGGARKLWNATRGVRESTANGVRHVASEFSAMPLDKKVTTVAALSGAVSAPAAAVGTLWNAFKN